MNTNIVTYTPFKLEETPRASTVEALPLMTTPEMTCWAESLSREDLLGHGAALLSRSLGQGDTSTLVYLASNAIAALESLARQGDKTARRFLPAIIRTAVISLNKNAEQFKEDMRRSPSWPVLYSPNGELGTDIDALKVKGVASKHDLAIMGKGTKRKKPVSFEAPDNKLVRTVHRVLSDNRRKWGTAIYRERLETDDSLPEWVRDCEHLPEFNTSTVEQWFTVAKKMLLHTFNAHPEQVPALRRLVKNSIRKKGDAHTRAGIFTALRAAYHALAQ